MANAFVNTTLMDGFADGPHVTAEQTGLANQGLYGGEDYVLNSGKKSEAQVLTNNSIRIFDAVYVIQGRRDVIQANGYTDVTIDNGAQNQYRHDIIVRRYQKDASTEIESTSYAVIKGTPASSASAAADPDVPTGDIRSGATLHNMKLFRVTLEGLNIVSVEPLFNILMSMSEQQQMIAELNSNALKERASKNISTGGWQSGNSSKSVATGIQYVSGDIPIVSDDNASDKAELIYTPCVKNGYWYISSNCYNGSGAGPNVIKFQVLNTLV